MKQRSDTVLRLIALFRLTKAVLLIGAAIALLRLVDISTMHRALDRLARFPRLLAFVPRLNPRRVELLAAAAFAYAALFTTEGIGLWLRKRWAEYLTLIATASFLPFEIYEAAERFTLVRLAIIILNVAIVVYLIWRVRSESA